MIQVEKVKWVRRNATHFQPLTPIRGQAGVEGLFALVVLTILAAPFVNLTRWYVVRSRAHLAARYGALLATSRRMSEAAAAEEVRRVLEAGLPRVRREAVAVRIGPADSRLAAPLGLVEVRVRVRIPWMGPRAWLERGDRGEVVVEESCVVAKAPRYWF